MKAILVNESGLIGKLIEFFDQFIANFDQFFDSFTFQLIQPYIWNGFASLGLDPDWMDEIQEDEAEGANILGQGQDLTSRLHHFLDQVSRL